MKKRNKEEVRYMNILKLMILILVPSAMFCQAIIDNKYSFKFDNVLKYNLSFSNGQFQGAERRLYLYKDFSNLKSNYVYVFIKPITLKEFKELKEIIRNKKFDKIDYFPNPYNSEDNMIYQEKNRYQCIIFHFNFLLHILGEFADEHDARLFYNFVKSYDNVKINL